MRHCSLWSWCWPLKIYDIREREKWASSQWSEEIWECFVWSPGLLLFPATDSCLPNCFLNIPSSNWPSHSNITQGILANRVVSNDIQNENVVTEWQCDMECDWECLCHVSVWSCKIRKKRGVTVRGLTAPDQNSVIYPALDTCQGSPRSTCHHKALLHLPPGYTVYFNCFRLFSYHSIVLIVFTDNNN